MKAANWKFEGKQGSTFDSDTFTIDDDGVPWNLTGWTARMQIRPFIASSKVLKSLTSSDGITLGGSAGTFSITISAADMAAMPSGTHRYDLEFDSGSRVYPILEGAFVVDPEVTR